MLASHVAEGYWTKHQIQTISIMVENAMGPDVVVHTYKPSRSNREAGLSSGCHLTGPHCYRAHILYSSLTYYVVNLKLLFPLNCWADGWARGLIVPGVFYHCVHHRTELSNLHN